MVYFMHLWQAPQRCPFLIPGIVEYITLHDKEDFVNVTKLSGKIKLDWVRKIILDFERHLIP